MSEQLLRIPDSHTKLDIFDGPEMSNFDHKIDPEMADLLKSQPVATHHSAWNFKGYVWWDGTQFCEEVWVYNSHRDTMCADTLEELMSIVNDRYGWS